MKMMVICGARIIVAIDAPSCSEPELPSKAPASMLIKTIPYRMPSIMDTSNNLLFFCFILSNRKLQGFTNEDIACKIEIQFSFLGSFKRDFTSHFLVWQNVAVQRTDIIRKHG